jgi:hypothetical protein
MDKVSNQAQYFAFVNLPEGVEKAADNVGSLVSWLSYPLAE